MKAYEVIQKDFKRLSSFTRSKSKFILEDPKLILLSKEYQEEPSLVQEKIILNKLLNIYQSNSLHLKEMVSRASSLGVFHTLWILDDKINSQEKQNLLKTPKKSLSSYKHSRLFSEKRSKEFIHKQAKKTLALLKSGIPLEEILTVGKKMNFECERVWRTESQQAYNYSTRQTTQKAGAILQAIEIIDSNPRDQSLYVDKTLSDESGYFLYPDGRKYLLGNSGMPEWDINERGISVVYKGKDIRKLEVGVDIPPPRSFALELTKNITLELAFKELFQILFPKRIKDSQNQ